MLCPICGGDYLHQGAVEVWKQEYGADTDGVRITKSGETTSPLADNPSRERRSLAIESEGNHVLGIISLVQQIGFRFANLGCLRVEVTKFRSWNRFIQTTLLLSSSPDSLPRPIHHAWVLYSHLSSSRD